LNNFPDDSIIIVIVRAGFFIVVSCAYPTVGQTVMAAWSQIIFSDDYPAGLIWWRRAIVLFVSSVIPLTIAMVFPQVKTVLEISGALGGCLVDFVFPAVLWIRHSETKITDYRNLFCIGLAAFGFICGIVSTYEAVIGAIEVFKN
jgi:Mn2+/Fe2+ NRAMP family transporter